MKQISFFSKIYSKLFGINALPELYLIGAGPGDPELITIKGQKALKTAAVILYA